MKNILIPYELFYLMIRYHFFGDVCCEDDIKRGLEEKVNALVNHDLYTKSKKAPTATEREKARKEYLDSREVQQDFRW